MSVNKSILDFEKIINKKFHEKYYLEPNYYNIIKIENIIYNDKSHLVSKFREQLILNDIFEYFSKCYSTKEIRSLLIKCFLYYEKNSFFFPNYLGLPEGKYIFRNIIEKQKLFDDQNSNNEDNIDNLDNKYKKKENKIYNNKIFDNSVYNSILKGSSFSVFDIRKNGDKLDSIADINNLILEIDNKNNKDKFNADNEKLNQIYLESKENIELKKLNRNNNIYIKNLFINKTNEKNQININKNEKIFSYIYIKSNIRQKLLNDRKNSHDKLKGNKNDTLLTPLNNTQFKTIINNNKSYKQKNFIYKKCSPIKTNNKINNINNKKELLKKFLLKNKKSYNKISDLNLEVFSYTNNENNIVNHTINNHYFNNNKNNFCENKTPIKENKISIIERKFETEINVENKTKNFFNIIPRENAIYIFNNNCINKQNLNINYKKVEPKLKNNQNKNKSSLQKEKKINKVSKKMKSFNCIIESIRKKIKKESKNNISKRIINLMNSKKELFKTNQKSSNNELNKNNIISLKKFMHMNKKRYELENEYKNKLILALEESNSKNKSNSNSKTKTLYNKEFKNSNFSLNKIKLNAQFKTKVHTSNKISSYLLSNLTSPISNKNKMFTNYNTINTSNNKRNKFILNTEKKTHNFNNYIRNQNNLFKKSILNKNEGNNNIKIISKPSKKTSKIMIAKNNVNKLNIITNKIKRSILSKKNIINTNNISNLKLKEINKMKAMYIPHISQQNNTVKNILKKDIQFN